MLREYNRENCNMRIQLWNKICFLVVWFLASCFFDAPQVMGQEIQFKSFPVPIRIDFGDCVESSLYIKCKSRSYNLPFPEFLSGKYAARETAFQQLTLALRMKNLPACLQVAFRERSWSEEEIHKQEENIGKMMNRFSKFIDPSIVGQNFERLRLTNQFYVGNGGIFICGMDSPSLMSPRPFRIAYTFQTNSEGKFLWKPVSGRPSELTILLRESVERRIISPERFLPKNNITLNYEFPVPGTTGTPHPVYLQFNGKAYNLDVFEDLTGSNDKVLNFYQMAYHTLRDNSPEAFAMLYTEKSRHKYFDWLSKSDPNYLESYHKDKITGGRKVVFIMNADPLYFVFYKKNNGVIQFDDIVLDPKDGKLKLTNFYYNDYVHHYLKDKKLFRDPVLKSLISN